MSDTANVKNDGALAIIMTAGSAPDAEALMRLVSPRLPGVEPPRDALHGALLLLLDDMMLSVSAVDAPCPIDDDDPCIRNAWYWPAASAEVKKHKAHLLVSVVGGVDPKRRSALLGQLVAASIEAAGNAVAVHWANSDSLWPPALVTKNIQPGDVSPPVLFCVASKLTRDVDGAISARTKGLAAFGLMELEVRGFRGDPPKLNGLLLDLAAYLLASGPVLKDGDTIGPDAATKIVVRHEASSFTPRELVYRLYFHGGAGA